MASLPVAWRREPLLVRIEKGGRHASDRRTDELRAVERPHDRRVVDAELARDRADPPVLGVVEPPDADGELVGDHRVAPPEHATEIRKVAEDVARGLDRDRVMADTDDYDGGRLRHPLEGREPTWCGAESAPADRSHGNAARPIRPQSERFGNLIVVVYSYRGPHVVRLISAWKASKRQRSQYAKARG